MLLIRGGNCLYPCPVCLVPYSELANYGKVWARRTVQESIAAVTCSKKKGEIDAATKALGLRPVHVCNFLMPLIMSY